MPIQNVSDTALWVAAYRALESDRDDALFRDPFARDLAGPEGERIARELRGRREMATGMAVRTRVIDDRIAEAVSQDGFDCVLDLACGLDTRPYRMELPPELRWVEADFGALLDYKQAGMKGARPRCRLESVRVDLSDGSARRAMLQQSLKGARKALVLTEGLLCYLEADQVAELARDLRSEPAVSEWVLDLFSSRFAAAAGRAWSAKLENAPLKFGAEPDFFGPLGWRCERMTSLFEEAPRLGRDFTAAWAWRPLLPFLPRKARAWVVESYSIVRLAPCASSSGNAT